MRKVIGRRWRRRAVSAMVALLMICLLPHSSLSYSVLTHEAIIDSTWDSDIKPILLKRFPDASAEDLKKARSYAYGGSIIQDMGYYPFGSKLFSDLTHYVRSGDFVEALIRDSQDLDEYAFALGALCHYAADNTGHPVAINQAVPILYPKLSQKYGNHVTYEDDPVAHIRTEFGFDVIEVARGHYASEDYHDFIGFNVSKPLLERAFQETYGIPLKSIFTSLDLALGTYRFSVSQVIPEMTKVAWKTYEEDIRTANPGVTRRRFLYRLSRADYKKEWGAQYQRPGLVPSILAIVLRLVPKVGPFKALKIKPSNPETEKLFHEAFTATINDYRVLLGQVRTNELHLRNRNFDTGKLATVGQYRLADRTYAALVDKLANQNFEHVSPEMRQNILAFYSDTDGRIEARNTSPQTWQRTQRELVRLRSMDSQSAGKASTR